MSKKISLKSKVAEWYNSCDLFAEEVLGEKLTHNQRYILKAITENNRISIKAANSIGKTFIMSIVIPWFFVTRYLHHMEEDGNSVIAVFTAPIFQQIAFGLWAGTKKNIKKAGKVLSKKFGREVSLFGKEPSEDMNSAKFAVDEDSYILGLSSKSGNEIAGKHAKFVLLVSDESQMVSDDVYSGFKGILQSGRTKEVLIGNSTLNNGCSGFFYESFQDNSQYKQITITSFDTPNFIVTGIKPEDYLREEHDPLFWRNKLDAYCKTDYRKSKFEGKIAEWEYKVLDAFSPFEALANPIGVNNILADCGYNFNDYEAKTRIFAEFPDSAGSETYPLQWIRESKEAWADPSKHILGKKYLGVDFGRGVGKDKSAFAYVNGNKCEWIKEYNLDTIGILDKVDEIALQYGIDAVKIENNGEGIHFGRLFRERGHKVLEIDVGSVAGYGKTNNRELNTETERLKKLFKLKRDETWWNLREKISPNRPEGEPLFLLPPDPDLEKQMRASNYKRDGSNMKIMVDSKDILRKRLKRSTDKLDALLAALARVDEQEDGLDDIDADNLYFFNFKDGLLNDD